MRQPRPSVGARATMVLAAVLTACFTLAAAAPPEAAAEPPPKEDLVVTITSPVSGTHTLYGHAYKVQFTAKVHNPPSTNCCTIQWSSNVDGALGTGKTLEHAFTTPGPRIVTARATHFKMLPGEASIKVFADNVAPKVWIDKPSGFVPTLYRHVPYKFGGSGYDANQTGDLGLAGDLPCASLKWSSWNLTTMQPGPSDTGCAPAITFLVDGTYEVRLNASDEHNAPAATAKTNVKVITKPAHTPPSVTLIQPDDGAFLYPGTTYALDAAGYDADGDPITYKWTMKDGANTKELGTGKQINWRPANDVPFNCGGRYVTLTVTATANNESTSASIVVKVGWEPCS